MPEFAYEQPSQLREALTAWRDALGAEAVLGPDAVQPDYCTYASGAYSLGRLQPADLDGVRVSLRIAGRFGISVYPVSTGKNWGYGSAAPARPAVVLDLSRLNRILDYDPVLGTVTLEPGVTQGQLHDFLREQGGNFWMDATGSSAECSVLGNTLERGFGHGPQSDHAGQVVRMEVLLPDGRLLRTGLGHFSGAKAADHYAAGLGPGLSQLFLQSNFGVVTRLTINLMPAPEYFQAFYFSGDNLAGLVEVLRPLRLRGVIRSALHLANGYRVLSSIRQYPWAEAQGRTPLPQNLLRDFAREWAFGEWNGSAALYGTRRQTAEARSMIRAALRGKVAKLRFMDDGMLARAKRWQHPYRWLTGVNLPEMLKLIEPVHEMMKGRPTDRMLASTYWRKKMPAPSDPDPDRDRCGLIWCAHVAPLKGECAQEMTDIAAKIVSAHGFEPGMTLTLINERCLDNVVSISYDREVPGEDERALACHAALTQALAATGYFPYRLGTHAMPFMRQYGDPVYTELLQRMKRLFDPGEILSPGRYVGAEGANPLAP